MYRVVVGLWFLAVIARIAIFTGLIEPSKFLKRTELLGAASALVLLGTGHPWELFLEAGYHGGQYLLARVMTSPRFVDWLMKEPPRR